MTERVYSVGILGCGMIANYHARALLEIPQARLAGAYEKNTGKAEDFCLRYGIQRFESMDALLSCEAIDAVCVCLPSGLHYSATLECIRHKKHVIVEKPMTFTVAQAEEIIRMAEAADVKVSVISQLRYTDAVAQLKQAVEQGYFGKMATVELSMKYYREPEYYSSSSWKGTIQMDGGGALMNQGIHGVDLMQYLAGPVVSVQALTATRCHAIEVEDTAAAVLEFESGALGVLQATTSVYPGFSRRLELCGTEGTAVLQEDTITYCSFRDPSHRLTCGTSGFSTGSRPDGMDHSLHKKQIADFLRCLSDDTQPFLNAYEGKKAVQLVEAVYRSAKTGEKIIIHHKEEEKHG